MFVKNYMTRMPVTISKKMTVFDALAIMKKHKIRQLPVVSGEKLEGLVTEKDLLTVSPSPATSLSIFELNELLAKMTVAEIMVKSPITVQPNTTLEEAALLMREHKIGSVPVLEKDKLVGIITVTDIFDALIRFFGYGKAGTRLLLEAQDRVGLLADITQVVKDFGLLIKASIVVYKDNENVEIMLRLGTIDPGPLVAALQEKGYKVTFEG
ncbi:Inosine-5'-monophosphate dehydrogenase [Pelotomaculum schinkii]|uniref:Inosine-5'-monophosphate dehydrogenase n=1 Tax=Pelotomaculum schinkii TaxID=78350 RepID=A0A4Y7R7G5_9FIRM|nr:CBS and ACT domain-containing protein [Pelotomaculum schinkii]TEB04898.1 Inosine-5'-monophosphate dehydrogenase [Pelotomaculum schinkii]